MKCLFFSIILFLSINAYGDPPAVTVPPLEGVQPNLVQPPPANLPPSVKAELSGTQSPNVPVNTPAYPQSQMQTPQNNPYEPKTHRISLEQAKSIPTSKDIRVMERRLKSLKSQYRVDDQVEKGTQRATHARFLRAKTIFPYIENSIYEINAAPERMTVIQLEPNENITGNKPKAADTQQWAVETTESGGDGGRIVNVLVKPLVPNIETNMFIATNKRVYYFVLRADTKAFMPLVAFSYPEEEVKESEARQKALYDAAQNQEPLGISPEKLNAFYSIEGDDVVWKPKTVLDDGSKTYLIMPPEVKNYEYPALFVIEDDSPPLLVNYRTKKGMLIVDRLFTKAQLRVGTEKKVNISRDGANDFKWFWE